jgi:hypothetical protein
MRVSLSRRHISRRAAVARHNFGSLNLICLPR